MKRTLGEKANASVLKIARFVSETGPTMEHAIEKVKKYGLSVAALASSQNLLTKMQLRLSKPKVRRVKAARKRWSGKGNTPRSRKRRKK